LNLFVFGPPAQYLERQDATACGGAASDRPAEARRRQE
jgi:hypothetical protein